MARILQFNFEDRLTQYIPLITGKSIVDAAINIHADTIVIFARDAWGRTYYESNIARKTEKLGQRDLLKEIVSEAKKQGLKVYVMIGHTTNPELYSIHPDWAQRDKHGNVITMDTNPIDLRDAPLRWPLMCLNSPFVEHVMSEVEEVMRYNVDGVFLDSFRYMPDLERACFCKYCRERFKSEYDIELPIVEDWDNLFFRKSFMWRYMVNVNAIRKIHEYIKSRDKDIPLIYNSHPAGWKGRANRIIELARAYIDIVFAECSEADYQPPGFIAEMVKLSLATSNFKTVWASRNSFHSCLTTISTTPIVVRQGIREAFIAGGEPLYLIFSSAFIQDKRVLDNVADVFKEIEKLEEYMTDCKRIRYAGVVFSNRSRDWGGRNNPEHITDCFRGFYYALLWSGLPVDYIADWQLDEGKIDDYRVIILANTQSMSKKSITNIERRKETGVIATYLASIMDEDGSLLEEFQLQSLLNIEFNGIIKHNWSYIYVNNRHPVTNGVLNQLLLCGDFDREFVTRRTPPNLGWQTRIKVLNDAKVLGLIGEPISEFGYEYENGRSPPLLGSITNDPAIVVNSDHKSVYFTGQIGRLYWRTGLLDYEKLILNSTLWAGGTPPIRLTFNGLVEMEAYMRNGQVLVHLLNHTYDRRIILRGNMGLQRGWSSTVESLMPPRNIVPLSDVRIILSDEFEVSKAYSPITNRKYNLRRSDKTTVVDIDKLHE